MKKIVVAACVVIALTIYSETEMGGNMVYHYNTGISVVAHRAGAVSAPENTLAALSRAVASGADEAEIDIQQLKDGTLIVMHDSNFKRTAGVDQDVWDAEYDQVKNYDGGSYFSPEFAGEPIPTLEDMLKNGKNKIGLMLELKLTGHEDGTALVEQTLELVRQYAMVQQCSIASMNLDILKMVKELDSRFKTIYITPLLYSGRYDMDFIDGYSVETTSLTRELAATAQFQGKKVYGWTANTEENIKKNMGYYVNGLVTDNPDLAAYYLEGRGEDRLLNAAVQVFFPQ